MSNTASIPMYLSLSLLQPNHLTRAPIKDTGIKAISNRINAEGDLMPNACTPCLKSLKNYNPDQTLGRGAKDYNELFS